MVLACFSATVKGVKLQDLGGIQAIRGEDVILQRDPSSAYNSYVISDQYSSRSWRFRVADVMLYVRGHLQHLQAVRTSLLQHRCVRQLSLRPLSPPRPTIASPQLPPTPTIESSPHSTLHSSFIQQHQPSISLSLSHLQLLTQLNNPSPLNYFHNPLTFPHPFLFTLPSLSSLTHHLLSLSPHF